MKRIKSRIIHGDVIDVLEKMDLRIEFDVIIADPPYNIGKDFGNNFDNRELNDYVEWCEKWIALCMKHLSENGLLYIYGFTEILARIAVLYPISKQRILIWHYTNKTSPSSQFWQRSHEGILCLWKDKRPDLEIDQIREPYSEAYLKLNGKVRKNTIGRFGSKETLYKVNKDGALPRDVIKIPALAGGAGSLERHFMCLDCDAELYHMNQRKEHEQHRIIFHPTQKPRELTEKLIFSRINGNNGRTLIPFAGSGSECVVAESHNIEYIGIELNSDYVDYANRWLKIVKDDGKGKNIVDV